MRQITTLIAAGCLLTGCVTTAEPTHRWASTEQADRAKYRADHARCQSQADVSASGAELDRSTPAFAAYKQCMNDEGYVLTAYYE